MEYDDVIVRDENGHLAVNTVSGTEADVPYNYDDCFTLDTNNRRALRVVGAGGGSVDYTKVIVKSDTMPTASASYLGYEYQYFGATDANYTHGYIYECVKNTSYTDSVTYEAATLSGTVVTSTTGDLAMLASQYITGDIESIVSGTLTYDSAGELWVFVGKDSEDNTVGTFQVYQQDYEDAGFTFTGTPEDGDVVAFTCTITDNSTYAWQRLNVQPTGETAIVNVSASTLTQELADNTIYNCGELSALTITFPASAGIGFISQVNFDSGTTETALTAPVDTVWLGDDIVSDVFVPVASKRYSVLFFNDGSSIRGIVQGA